MGDAIRVGVAVVEQAGRFLVGIRESTTVLAGKAEFPGGKCLPGETATSCAVRECQEESGLLVEPVRILSVVEHDYPHGRVQLEFVLCRPLEDLVTEANRFRWVERAELTELEFPAANRDLVRQLAQFPPADVWA